LLPSENLSMNAMSSHSWAPLASFFRLRRNELCSVI
jgi:hypothetical protein